MLRKRDLLEAIKAEKVYRGIDIVEKIKPLQERIDNLQNEIYTYNTFVHAILNYLNVDIKREVVRDPRFAPVEQPTTEIITLKEKSNENRSNKTKTKNKKR